MIVNPCPPKRDKPRRGALQKLQRSRLLLGSEIGTRHAVAGGMANLKDLIVWQLAEELRAEIVRLSNEPAARRDFRFRDQIVRAASSVAANIAEGYGRAAHTDFARFIGIATGSLRETETWIRDGISRKFWPTDNAAAALLLCKRLTVGLNRLRTYLQSTPTPKR